MTANGSSRRPMRGPLTCAALAALILSCGPSAPAGVPAPAAAPAAPASDGTPAAVTYRPFNASYRAVSHGRVAQEFSGQTTASDFTLQYFLTARIEPGDGGHRLTLRLDSIPTLRGTALAFSEAEARRARGATFTGTLTPTGEIAGFDAADTTSTLLQQLAHRLREFFPRIPPGGARAGATWVDTTTTTSGAAGLALTITSVNRHEAVGWVEQSGQRALHIASVSDYTMRGTGTQGGQEFTIAGTGRREGHQYITADGRYLGLAAADSSEAAATLAAMGIVIPIVQTRHDTLTALP